MAETILSATNTLAHVLLDAVEGVSPAIHVEPTNRRGDGNLKILVDGDDLFLEMTGTCWVLPGQEQLGISLSSVRCRQRAPFKQTIEFAHIPPSPFYDWALRVIREADREAEIIGLITGNAPWSEEQEQQRRDWRAVDRRINPIT